MKPKYTIKDFNKQFRNDVACLEYIYRQRYPQGATCSSCGKTDHFHHVEGRRSYACMCGTQIYPTEGTIFHKSSTSLRTWFFAMFLMTASKNGVSAKELERQLGVTYKCAWRIAHQIRLLLKEGNIVLSGIVETDETYIGGRKYSVGSGSTKGKTPVAGVVERGGMIVAQVVANRKAESLLPPLEKVVMPQSTIITDEWRPYRQLKFRDFKHETVAHSKREYVRGIYHTNTIEGFWGQLKRSINGTFHHVSRKHLQKYVNEFSYRYNRRKSETPMFLHVAANAGSPHAAGV